MHDLALNGRSVEAGDCEVYVCHGDDGPLLKGLLNLDDIVIISQLAHQILLVLFVHKHTEANEILIQELFKDCFLVIFVGGYFTVDFVDQAALCFHEAGWVNDHLSEWFEIFFQLQQLL